MVAQPSVQQQEQYWNGWVEESRTWEANPDNARRAQFVLRAVDEIIEPDHRVIDIGCGTGWLTMELTKRSRHVTGLDLASDAMTALQRGRPDIEWIGDDFMSHRFDDPFDIVVSMETISHVPDQAAFAQKVADITCPGGTLVLTSQNPWVWRRTSWVKPRAPGQLRNWVGEKRLRQLFGGAFRVMSVRTCALGGDRGLARLVHNGLTQRVGQRLLGAEAWTTARERLGLGRSLVLVARRR